MADRSLAARLAFPGGATGWFESTFTRDGEFRADLHGHAEMQRRPPGTGQPVVERPAHELMREPIRQPVRRQLLDEAVVDSLVEGRKELDFRAVRPAAHEVELELRASRGRELKQVARRGRQA